MDIKFIKIVSKNLDLLFRVFGLGGKFLLMLALVKTLPAADIGYYGLVTASVSVCLYFVGLDFYTFSTREILSKKGNILGDIIYNQFLFFLITYTILFLVWSDISGHSGIIEYSGIAFSLVITEHLSQELYRIFILLKRNSFANFSLFLRSGAWCYILIPCLFFNSINLKSIFLTWFTFSLFTVLLSIIYLKKIGKLKISTLVPNFLWIIKGIKVCAFFFVGTMALRSISYLDKVIALEFTNISIIGTYVFYTGIANAIQAVIDVLVMTRYYPDVVKSAQSNDEKETKETLRNFKSDNLTLNIVLYSLGAFFCYSVVLLTENNIYLDSFHWFLLISLSNIILNLSMPYHYWIYAKKNDSFIVITNILYLLLFIAISYIGFFFYPHLGMIPVLLAITTSNIFLIFRKRRFYYKAII